MLVYQCIGYFQSAYPLSLFHTTNVHVCLHYYSISQILTTYFSAYYIRINLNFAPCTVHVRKEYLEASGLLKKSLCTIPQIHSKGHALFRLPEISQIVILLTDLKHVFKCFIFLETITDINWWLKEVYAECISLFSTLLFPFLHHSA